MENVKIELNFKKYNLNELSAAQANLLKKAQESVENAYAPYSNFLVGAAVLLEDGTIVLGNNQENAAYPSGLCAERTALFAASANNPNVKVKMLAVAARKASEKKFLAVAPCGACRQVMLEYEFKQKEPIEFIMQADDHSVYISDDVSVLLPFKFTSDDL